MPTTVNQLFKAVNITNHNRIRWGTPFYEKEQGVYVVSMSDNPNLNIGLTKTPLFDDSQINLWMKKVPLLRLEGSLLTIESLKNHLTEIWLPDETILYIGKAPKRKSEKKTGISNRVREYFSTIIGNRGPHSGGQWIKILLNLNQFSVYYSPCDDPTSVEDKMLDVFIQNVSSSSLSKLYDPELPLPFANIKHKGVNKKHKFKKQRL